MLPGCNKRGVWATLFKQSSTVERPKELIGAQSTLTWAALIIGHRLADLESPRLSRHFFKRAASANQRMLTSGTQMTAVIGFLINDITS